MRFGFALPNIGPVATPEAVSKVAQRAEALGYETLWTIERLLWPVKLQTPYPATPFPHQAIRSGIMRITCASSGSKPILY